MAGFALVMAVVLTATGLFVYQRQAANLNQTIDRSLRARAADVSALAQHPHDILRLGGLGEGSEAAQIAEQGHDLAAVILQHGLVVAGRDDGLGKLRRQEPAQTPNPLQFLDLVAHLSLETPV